MLQKQRLDQTTQGTETEEHLGLGSQPDAGRSYRSEQTEAVTDTLRGTTPVDR